MTARCMILPMTGGSLFMNIPAMMRNIYKFSKAEMEGIIARDAEDDEKLAAGIRMAVAKEVVPADPPVEPTAKIDVLGKTADEARSCGALVLPAQ